MSTNESVLAPFGWDEINQFYGDIRKYITEDGAISPKWEMEKLIFVDLPFDPLPLGWETEPGVISHVSRIRCHRRIAWPLWRALDKIREDGLRKELKTFDGGFNFRRQRGAKKLSMHAFGAAFDFNADRNQLGEVPMMHHGIVEAFEGCGFTWGGRWDRPDGMHFQFGSGY